MDLNVRCVITLINNFNYVKNERENMKFNVVYLTVLIIFVTGCASNINTPPLSSLSTHELRVFNDDEIANLKYSSLGEVKGVDCSPTWFRFASSANAMNKLLEEAKNVSANGLINITCWDSGVGPIAWCNNSATCKGEAVLYEGASAP